ncbi:hypothetical protein ACK8HX_02195 [Oryzobacter sp. R7]|uniref:hypothetical protein n=1 Tax=Oryzobacter faecalis TaxID=3388656 RepID=UPI00398CE0FE
MSEQPTIPPMHPSGLPGPDSPGVPIAQITFLATTGGMTAAIEHHPGVRNEALAALLEQAARNVRDGTVIIDPFGTPGPHGGPSC